MVDWEVTATTIYCDSIDDEVTIIVHKDFSTKCTGYDKYSKANKEALNLLKKKSKQLRRQLDCAGLECPQVVQYREKLLAEEARKGN